MRRQAVCLLILAAALANSGCLLVAAGAAGGAAVGYAYCKGKVCQVYDAGVNDTWAAVHTALAELGMPVIKEEGDSGFIMTRDADGERVRIYVKGIPSKIPAEGEVTRVCVRVATFGDHPVSVRILDQIGFHLASPSAARQQLPPPPPGVVPTAASGPPPLAAPAGASETAPPPILPAQPVPVGK